MNYIYIKIHNDTNKKYLGKTISDPYTYKGSGTRWKRHINKHGYNVTTRVIYKTDCKQQLKEAGLIFSEMFNIIESDEFLNIVAEEGDGGNTRDQWTAEQYSNWRAGLNGHKKKNTENMKLAQQRDAHIRSDQQKEWHSNPDNYKKKLDSMKTGCHTPEARKKQGAIMKTKKWCNDGVRNYRKEEIPEGYSSGRI